MTTKTTTATAETKSPTCFAARGFTDAGTGRSFDKGADLSSLDEDIVANYRAAGLVSAEKPEAPAAA